MNLNFLNIINASENDRRDLFLAPATRLGTTLQNIEKDFWFCWVLDLLFNDKNDNEPRLLSKSGTSLSKVYGSDQGIQYTRQEYQAILKPYGVTISMSRKGNCWDNSVMERFFEA